MFLLGLFALLGGVRLLGRLLLGQVVDGLLLLFLGQQLAGSLMRSGMGKDGSASAQPPRPTARAKRAKPARPAPEGTSSVPARFALNQLCICVLLSDSQIDQISCHGTIPPLKALKINVAAFNLANKCGAAAHQLRERRRARENQKCRSPSLPRVRLVRLPGLETGRFRAQHASPRWKRAARHWPA